MRAQAVNNFPPTTTAVVRPDLKSESLITKSYGAVWWNSLSQFLTLWIFLFSYDLAGLTSQTVFDFRASAVGFRDPSIVSNQRVRRPKVNVIDLYNRCKDRPNFQWTITFVDFYLVVCCIIHRL
jgi:hypothetical protein